MSKFKVETNDQIKAELETVRQKNGGLLRPADVVNFAKNKKTRLHSMFEWDNTKAAQEYRIWQAQSIIRVIVTVHDDTGEDIRAFVSLRSDRTQDVGYRAIADVIDDDRLMELLLEDAKKDLEHFSSKYKVLRKVAELSGLFVQVDQVIESKKTKAVKVKAKRGRPRKVVQEAGISAFG